MKSLSQLDKLPMSASGYIPTALDKLLKDVKFLEQVKRAALNHRDDIIPEFNGEVYTAMMWSRGMVDVLKTLGFVIEKKDPDIEE